MTSMYQPGIPTGRVNLDLDYQNIQNNFQQLDTTFNVGHTLFSDQTAQNGFHRNIQMIPNSTTVTHPPNNQPPAQPATIAGFGQLWSAQTNDGINSDEALYFLTGGGRNIQLTRNFLPVAANNGFTFLSGGIIMQWGIVTPIVNNTTGTPVLFVTSNINFPTSCFNVSATLITKVGGASSTDTISIVSGSVSNTGFSYNYTGASSYVAFYWTALGI